MKAAPHSTALFSLASMVIQAFTHLVDTPARTTAAEFPRYSNGEVLADSSSLRWPGLFVRRSRFPGNGEVSAAVRHARAYRPRSEAHPRYLPEPHRDRARSRLHEPEPFCSSLPACGWRGAHRVPHRLVVRLTLFSARTRQAAHDRERSAAYDARYSSHA